MRIPIREAERVFGNLIAEYDPKLDVAWCGAQIGDIAVCGHHLTSAEVNAIHEQLSLFAEAHLRASLPRRNLTAPEFSERGVEVLGHDHLWLRPAA